ncbi:BTAD domain-containing putative transcriptional regulator [Cryptosporangium sp. NPDC048952]|uniref:BTAD domain-containing putative transcriptional regulator n=1 Tax=Cryptosporangium sp. NPDC048952 TaxID=3363961 RepID=UPI003718C4DB
MLRFGVLGPLVAHADSGPLDLKGPRHRAVLARLLVARGRMVPVDTLIDDMWGAAAPMGAVGAVQTFVAALRKSLEPDRAPRAPASVLVTLGRGYALRIAPEAVDALRFETTLTTTRALLTTPRATPAHAPGGGGVGGSVPGGGGVGGSVPRGGGVGGDPPLDAGATESAEQALERLDRALGEWRGPAYAEFADLAWARGEAARLDELRLLAFERRAEALLLLGHPAEVVPDLEAQVDARPGREGAWRLFALALYRSGRQSDALAALRRARRVLAESAGLDPGPDLQRLEADILAHSPTLARPDPLAHAAPTVTPNPAATPNADRAPHDGATTALPEQADAPAATTSPTAALSGRSGETAAPMGETAAPMGETAAPMGETAAPMGATAELTGWADATAGLTELAGLAGATAGLLGLVGRVGEISQLAAAAADVRARRVARLVLLSGEAGAGKTALVSAFADHLSREGWTTAWGTNPDDPGLPDNWAWTQILETLPTTRPGTDRPEAREVAPGAAATRFERHRAVIDRLETVARHNPLLIVVDDVHWAGTETLGMLAAAVTEPPAGPVLIIATYRSTDLPPGLAETLGRVARAEPTRVYLGGLPAGDVPALVRATIGRSVDPDTATLIHRRTGGNPFFVRELARLVAADGDLTAVPPGVRDVVRYRLAALPGPTQAILRQAAVLGPDLDTALQTVLSDDANSVLDAVDLATTRGFLVERDPHRFAFAHALVRDALASDVSAARRASWHAAAARALETLRPDDVEALAHHYLLAGDPADRIVHYSRAAAERAERRAAPADALRYWTAALTAYDAGDVRIRLDLVMGTVRALALTGRLAAARTRRAEAVDLADAIGDPLLTARVIAAFDTPALWPDADDPALARHVAEVTERTLAALPTDRIADRSRLLATLALELRSAGGARAADAAHEAERLARGLGDSGVLAFALNARFMHSFGRSGLASERARIGAELVELSARDELRTFEILGHLIAMQARSALADFVAADEHADTVDRLGERYQSPLVTVFTDWYRAMRASVVGRSDAAALYRAAAVHLGGTEMSGMDRGIAPFARFCEASRRGEPLAPFAGEDFGSFTPWTRPFLHADLAPAPDAAGPGSAEAAEVPESPRDLLYEARTCLHALVALRGRDRELMERLYDALLPARDELAGAGSGLLTLHPVAHYLSDLASALHRPAEAAAHHRQALRVLHRAQNDVPLGSL